MRKELKELIERIEAKIVFHKRQDNFKNSEYLHGKIDAYEKTIEIINEVEE